MAARYASISPASFMGYHFDTVNRIQRTSSPSRLLTEELSFYGYMFEKSV